MMSQVKKINTMQMGRRARKKLRSGGTFGDTFLQRWSASPIVWLFKFLAVFGLRFPKYVTWLLLNECYSFREAGSRLVPLFYETPQEIIPKLITFAKEKPEFREIAIQALARFKEHSAMAAEWVISCLRDSNVHREASYCIGEMRSAILPHFKEAFRQIAQADPNQLSQRSDLYKEIPSLSLCLSNPIDQAEVLMELLSYMRRSSVKNKAGLIFSCQTVLSGFKSHVLADQYDGQALLNELRTEIEFFMLTADQHELRIAEDAIREFERRY